MPCLNYAIDVGGRAVYHGGTAWFSSRPVISRGNSRANSRDAGAVIRGSGGVRKVRWAARGKGKSGGVRVIYYWMQAAERIHLLLIYGKGEQADLSAADLQRVRTLVEQIKDD